MLADSVAQLEITKAVTYLKMKDFKSAIDTLKAFEKKETKMVGYLVWQLMVDVR